MRVTPNVPLTPPVDRPGDAVRSASWSTAFVAALAADVGSAPRRPVAVAGSAPPAPPAPATLAPAATVAASTPPALPAAAALTPPPLGTPPSTLPLPLALAASTPLALPIPAPAAPGLADRESSEPTEGSEETRPSRSRSEGEPVQLELSTHALALQPIWTESVAVPANVGEVSPPLRLPDGLDAHLVALDARVSVQSLDGAGVAEALRVFAAPFMGIAAGSPRMRTLAAGPVAPTRAYPAASASHATPQPDLDEIQARFVDSVPARTPVQDPVALDENLDLLDGEVEPMPALSLQPPSAGPSSVLAADTEVVFDVDGIGRAETVRLLQDAHALPSTGITLRLDDALGHWEVDLIRRDQLIDLVVRGDAGLQKDVLASTPELRERLSHEGLLLNRVAFSDARSELKTEAKAGSGAGSDSAAQHQASRDSNPQRKEEPSWVPPRMQAPRRPGAPPTASLPTASAPTPRGSLNRVV